MKQKVLRFLREYQLCFFLCGILAVGLIVVSRCRNLYVRNDYFRTNFGSDFFLLGMPLLSFGYGAWTYAKLKKVWMPFLILFLGIFFIMLVFWPEPSSSGYTTAYAALFSLIGTGVTALVVSVSQAGKDKTD